MTIFYLNKQTPAGGALKTNIDFSITVEGTRGPFWKKRTYMDSWMMGIGILA